MEIARSDAIRRIAIVVVLAAVLTLAGCTLLSQDPTYPSDSEIRSELTSLETMEADIVSRTATNGTETSTRIDLVRNFSADSVRSTTVTGNASGTTFVANANRTSYYFPDSNTVRVYDSFTNGTRGLQQTVDQMTSIYRELRSGDAEDSIGISTAPTVPSASGQDGSSPRVSIPLAGNVTVSDEGTATIDGRTTRVVRLVGTGDVEYIRNATYWIDQEWHLPLQSRVTLQVGGDTTTVTTTYTNVTINDAVDTERFTFDPPATAREIRGTQGSLRSYEIPSQLRNATPHAVPDPDLPAEYEFQVGELSPANASQGITMIYAGESDTITISKLPDRTVELAPDAERIDVAGNEGRVVSAGPNTAIVWICGGNSYSVTGASSAPLRKIARSMACA